MEGDWWWNTTTTPTFLISPDKTTRGGTLRYYATGTNSGSSVTIATFDNTYWDRLYSYNPLTGLGYNWMVSAATTPIHDEL